MMGARSRPEDVLDANSFTSLLGDEDDNAAMQQGSKEEEKTNAPTATTTAAATREEEEDEEKEDSLLQQALRESAALANGESLLPPSAGDLPRQAAYSKHRSTTPAATKRNKRGSERDTELTCTALDSHLLSRCTALPLIASVLSLH